MLGNEKYIILKAGLHKPRPASVTGLPCAGIVGMNPSAHIHYFLLCIYFYVGVLCLHIHLCVRREDPFIDDHELPTVAGN